MRLADFILGNIEPILLEWEAFARSIWPGAKVDPLTLRDHARDILRATASDMKSAQTAVEQSDKSKGEGHPGRHSARVEGASDVHGVGRVRSGFDLMSVVAEYRALRASVIRLWRESRPDPDLNDLADLTRFNESIDQSVTEALRSFSQRVDRSRQMFLGILGHDLRNPLNCIMMLAGLLVATTKHEAESSDIASQISASAEVMARMISDLLEFTAAGLDTAMPISVAPMDLQNICREVIGETRAANPARTVCFQSQDEIFGEWDSARLRQMISNLLGNALQHGSTEGPIELSVTANASEAKLAVHNSGSPIPQDALGTLFDPLVRGSSPQTQSQRRPGSLGLGLYIAREVAMAHGGIIDVQSSEKAGTTFTVHLPINGPKNQPVANDPPVKE